MNTIFMYSENSKTSKPHVLILKLTDKLDLRRGEKGIALSNLSIYYTWKNIKSTYTHTHTHTHSFVVGVSGKSQTSGVTKGNLRLTSLSHST